MMMDSAYYAPDLFKHKTVLITGGGSGIGKTIAQHFLYYGARVFIASRKPARLEKAIDELRQYGPVEAVAADVRNTQMIADLAHHIQSNTGQLDILINNAGGQFPSPAEFISENGWNAVINTNLNGTFYVTQQMAKTFFIPQKSGVVVNIIVAIYKGFPGMAHTGAARAGVDNLTKSLAIEWAKNNIRINAIAPGVIHSSGLENYPPELLTGISSKIPLKRLGTTNEVAHLALFLSSPLANFITGETIYVDGGQRLWGDLWEIPG
ncbi:MAG: SDR family oxidoreductase [Chitinophagales bacterium]|nr:SDR family oxidoreductase [Chitinophagales bacterium]